MEGLDAFRNYVKTTLNLGSILKEVDWGGKIDPNYTSSRCMLMEVDWGGKLRVNHIHECMPCESDWGAHETHQNEHSTTRVHWGDNDPSLNPMDIYSIFEVDWGAHDSSCLLYLVYIDLDAKPKDFFTQELCGGLPQSSTPLIGLNHVEGKLVHDLAPQKGPNRLDYQLDQHWDPTQCLEHLLSSSDPDLCPSPCLSLIITVLLVGHSYYLLENGERFNFHLPHGISEIFF